MENYQYSNNYNYNGYNNYNQYNNKDPKFTRNLILSIFEMLCCFQVCGIIALIFSLMAKDSYKQGNVQAYNKYCKYTNITLVSGITIGIAVYVLSFFLGVFAGLAEIISEDSSTKLNYSSEYTCEMIGEEFILNDDSYLILDDSMDFEWYMTEDDLTDNYYEGTYEIYTEDNALDYLVTLDYGVTKEEMEEYFERNEDSQLYNLDNLTVLVLHTDIMKYNGEFTDEFMEYKYYFGFYNDGIFDAARIDNGNYTTFYMK